MSSLAIVIPDATSPAQEAILLILTSTQKAVTWCEAKVQANDLIKTSTFGEFDGGPRMSEQDKNFYISRRDAAKKAYDSALKMYSAHNGYFLGHEKPGSCYDGHVASTMMACMNLRYKAHAMSPEAELFNPLIACCQFVATYVPMKAYNKI